MSLQKTECAFKSVGQNGCRVIASPMVLLILSSLFSLPVHATSMPEKSLDELVNESNHVIVAHVVKVDMVNAKGEEVTDKSARTGPGLENQIRFHLDVIEILYSTSASSPKKLVLPLWQAWHYQLGTLQDAVSGETSIFLLKGTDYEPVYPAYFQRSLKEKTEIEHLVKRYKNLNK